MGGFKRGNPANEFLMLDINLPVGEAGEIVAGSAMNAVLLNPHFKL